MVHPVMAGSLDAFGVLTQQPPRTLQCCILKDGVSAYSENFQSRDWVDVFCEGGFAFRLVCTYKAFHAFMNSYETNRWEGLRLE